MKTIPLDSAGGFMNPDEPDTESCKPRPLMALPGRVSDESPSFHRRMAEVLELVGGRLPPGPGPAALDRYKWEHAARAAVVADVSDLESWPEEVFEALVRAIVLDPDPSFNRQLIEPALAAVGRRKVQEALLETLAGGSDAEKAGSARAWYWTQVPMRYVNWEERIPTEESKREYDAVADLRSRWREAALREFVANDDLDVRRCILPGLTLDPARCPDNLKDLVAAAVHLARTHPDDYIRHRVEHQV